MKSTIFHLNVCDQKIFHRAKKFQAKRIIKAYNISIYIYSEDELPKQYRIKSMEERKRSYLFL